LHIVDPLDPDEPLELDDDDDDELDPPPDVQSGTVATTDAEVSEHEGIDTCEVYGELHLRGTLLSFEHCSTACFSGEHFEAVPPSPSGVLHTHPSSDAQHTCPELGAQLDTRTSPICTDTVPDA